MTPFFIVRKKIVTLKTTPSFQSPSPFPLDKNPTLEQLLGACGESSRDALEYRTSATRGRRLLDLPYFVLLPLFAVVRLLGPRGECW
jgi:hypothetical protein